MITEPLVDDDHVEIRDLVRSVVEATFTSERVRAAADSPLGYDEIAWKQLVDLGWPAVAQEEAAGGDGLGVVVQAVIHRELGARLAPSPYLASVGLAATALAVLGGPGALELRCEIADGSRTAALVTGHGRGWPADDVAGVTARREGDAWLLDGSASAVLDGGRADVLVVLAQVSDGGWGVFAVPGETGQVRRTPLATVDATRSLADLVLDSAPAVPLHSEPATACEVADLVDRLVVPLAAEMVGAAVSCLRQTLDFLRTRHQFGRPIGSFQALKHRCADTAVAVTVVQEHLFAAAAMAEGDDVDGLRLMAPLLLGRAGEVFRHVTEEAIQLHGGVGFSHEVDIGLYYKRAISDVELLAAPEDALARMDLVRCRAAL